MTNGNKSIEWKIHCASTAKKIFHLLNSSDGRKAFWAESAEEMDGEILFVFSNGQRYTGRILSRVPHREFSVAYFDTLVTFKLSASDDGGTDVMLVNDNVPADELEETKAGWVSVLLALKTYADFGIDIRNHSPKKNWDTRFVDN